MNFKLKNMKKDKIEIKKFSKVLILLSIYLTSCGPNIKLESCQNGKCETVAKFETVDACERYTILYYSYIDYEELLKEGKTIVSYERKVDDQSVICKK